MQFDDVTNSAINNFRFSMNPARMVYEDAPSFIPVPSDLQHRRVEAILWPLDMPTPATLQPNMPAQTTPNNPLELKTIPLSQLIGIGKGCFESASDIDMFIRSERDTWER